MDSPLKRDVLTRRRNGPPSPETQVDSNCRFVQTSMTSVWYIYLIMKYQVSALLRRVPLYIFYAINLYYFYAVIIFSRKSSFSSLCDRYFVCDRHRIPNILGWQTDLSDSQWRSFRSNLLLLSAVAIGLSFVSRACNFFFPGMSQAPFRALSGVIILFVQHGYHAFIILALTFLSYALAWSFAGSFLGPLSAWSVGIFVLLLKESYRVQHLPYFHFLQPLFSRRYAGMHGWQFAANFLILRLISFGMDLHWKRCMTNSADRHRTQSTSISSVPSTLPSDASSTLSLRNRSSSPPLKPSKVAAPSPDDHDFSKELTTDTSVADFTLLNLIAYVVYAPLYLAGPIVSFNDFVGHNTKMQKQVDVTTYAMRFLVLLLIMEWSTANFPIFGLMNAGLIPYMSTTDIAVAFYVLLKLMWLKFTCMWRFFRLWSLADGVYAEENMLRCMSNNYSLEQFWRGWHTSFNKWIVRYIYKPLGGRHYRAWSVWIVFFFVAIWHDIEVKLLLWGAMNGIFYLLETFCKRQWALWTRTEGGKGQLRIAGWIDHVVSSIAGALYVVFLMIINLTGYAMGAGTLTLLQDKVLSAEGIRVLIASVYFLSVGVSIMLHIRGK